MYAPRDADGLLVTCRAISLDRDAHMLVRMQREMQKIGEVAGVASVQSIREGREPRDIDIKTLQKRLLARGVVEPEDLDQNSIAVCILPLARYQEKIRSYNSQSEYSPITRLFRN